MEDITLIFPDQLFEKHPALAPKRPVYLVEEFLFFRAQPFHKQKLVLLRAAMLNYANFLQASGFQVIYIESHLLKSRGDLFSMIAKKRIREIHLAEFADEWLQQDLCKGVEKHSWHLQFYPSPSFLCSESEIRTLFEGRDKFSMAQFYSHQRKKLNILMDGSSPVGGKFSFDAENRKKVPKGLKIPSLYVPPNDHPIDSAIEYVMKNFADAYGEADPFLYPVTFSQAKKALLNFIQNRLYLFGDYEDAILEKESFLFHSVLSPLLNIGLLTPREVIDSVLLHHQKVEIPLNSLEGFLRQIIGWREYMRACYLLKGNTQRTSNYFQHHTSLPKSFWEGTTGLRPIDMTIKKVLKTGYCHHIERLMVLGNFLLLTETHPDAVYEWFMGCFVDAYDWVMVPNVYGMSQYADKGLMTTKPYISGSNYILKMSDYTKGDWSEVWDGLFWRFLAKHKPLFAQNPRTSVLLKMLDKNAESILPKIEIAENWLSNFKKNLR